MAKVISKKIINLDFAALILRVGFGLLMLLNHGLGKAKNLVNGNYEFANMFGLGETLSLILAVLAEFVCAALIVSGLLTRLSTLPLIIIMLIAAFYVHSADPLSTKETALIYATAFIAIFLLGPGKYSIDQVVLKK